MSSFINGAEAVEKKKFGKTENIVEKKLKEGSINLQLY
jgi:hypothetical protein